MINYLHENSTQDKINFLWCLAIEIEHPSHFTGAVLNETEPRKEIFLPDSFE